MTVPATLNYIPQYLAVLPPRCEFDLGTCTDCDALYGIELRGILTGQKVVQLSQCFSMWNQHSQGNTIHPPPYIGGATSYALHWAQTIGVCAECFWPVGMIGNDDYQLSQIVETTAPGSPAYADAAYHKVTDFVSFQYDGTPADKIAKLQAALAAGYPVSCDIPSQNHAICAMGYDATGILALDPRSGQPQAAHFEYTIIYPKMITRAVSFTAEPTVEVSQDLIDQYQTLIAGIVMPTITQMQVAQLQSLAAQFGGAAPPPPPPPPSTNPVKNPGFEAPATLSYIYQPATADVIWTFVGSAGIERNGSGWNATAAPEGIQACFLQNQGSISQSVTLTAGSYTLSFYCARRGSQVCPIKVTLDGTQIGPLITPAGSTFAKVSLPITVTDGAHVLGFAGTNAAGDQSSFIDAVSIA